METKTDQIKQVDWVTVAAAVLVTLVVLFAYSKIFGG